MDPDVEKGAVRHELKPHLKRRASLPNISTSAPGVLTRLPEAQEETTFNIASESEYDFNHNLCVRYWSGSNSGLVDGECTEQGHHRGHAQQLMPLCWSSLSGAV